MSKEKETPPPPPKEKENTPPPPPPPKDRDMLKALDNDLDTGTQTDETLESK